MGGPSRWLVCCVGITALSAVPVGCGDDSGAPLPDASSDASVDASMGDPDTGGALDGGVDAGDIMDGSLDGGMDAGASFDQSCDVDMDLGSAMGVAVATLATADLGDDVTPECAVVSSTAPDAIFRWTAPSAGVFVFDTFESSFDTVLHVRDEDCALLGCQDDPTVLRLQSRVEVELEAGQVVFVAVDGSRREAGDAVLSITQPPASETLCDDGLDDDRDGQTDCVDDDCRGEPACVETDCDNGIDDDGDFAPDCFDNDCRLVPPCAEASCDNGSDDDGDGAVDCDDPDCLLQEPCREVLCADGLDGDGDALSDCDDPDCACDAACRGTPACPDEDLGSAVGTAVATGMTGGQCSDFALGTCTRRDTGPDVAFAWSPPEDGVYAIDTIGSDFDTVLYLLEGDCEGTELVCNNDRALGSPRSSLTTPSLTAGTGLVIVVDGVEGFGIASGNYVLNIVGPIGI